MTTTVEKTTLTLESMIKSYARYNAWATETIAKWLLTKDEEWLEKEVASSFPSIRLTLIHLLSSQQFWLDCIKKEPFEGKIYDNEETFYILKSLVKNSLEFSEFVEGLTEEELTEHIYLKTTWFESNRARIEYIQHAINHTTYHRGQVVTIGRQLGYEDAPMTDYNFFLLMA